MGYTVQYGTYKYDRIVSSKRKYLAWGALILAVLLCAFSLAFPDYASRVRDIAFPFLKPEVRTAFGEMMTQIGRGTKISEAAAAFCREIVFEAAY